MLWNVLWYFISEETTDVGDVSNETLLKMISFATWGTMYIAIMDWTAGSHSAEWCCRAVTLLHGSLATVVGLSHCDLFHVDMSSFQGPCLPEHYALMLMSWGYFTFDLVWCVVYWTESVLMFGHHIAAIVCITRFMHKRASGCIFGCTIGALEVTNPLLQMRWFLKDAKYDKTFLFVAVEAVYFVLFIVVRGPIGTVATYKVVLDPDIDLETKIFGIALYIVSVLFIKDIFEFIWAKYPARVAVIKETITSKFQTAQD